jgi:hypothetical protein
MNGRRWNDGERNCATFRNVSVSLHNIFRASLSPFAPVHCISLKLLSFNRRVDRFIDLVVAGGVGKSKQEYAVWSRSDIG